MKTVFWKLYISLLMLLVLLPWFIIIMSIKLDTHIYSHNPHAFLTKSSDVELYTHRERERVRETVEKVYPFAYVDWR